MRTIKKRHLDWIISYHNPTPLEFFRLIQPTHKPRALEKYNKTLNQAINSCKDPDKTIQLKKMQETANVCNRIYLLEHIREAV